MKRNYIAPILMTLSTIACSVSATTLDYRHEYTQHSHENADRVQFSNTFANHVSVSAETKWASKNTDSNDVGMYDNLVAKGSIFEVGYKWDWNSQNTFAPSVALDSTSELTDYQFNLKNTYKITKEFYVAGRYRYGSVQYDRNKNTDNRHYHRGDFYIGYNFPYAKIEYNLTYKWLSYNNLFGDKKYYEHNVVVQVPIDKSWTPFMELGYMPYKDNTKYPEDWEIRYRLGVKYNF